MQKHSSEQGFTLIELIVVIVILGILAAFAIPRFVNLQDDARRSVLQGVSGSLQAASALVYSKSLINGTASTASSSANIGQGVTIATAFGYPTAGSISQALQNLTNISTNNSGTFWPTSASDSANCEVVYTAATSSIAPATVSTNSSNCS
ncbi:prepilin-type N-terminal cleavage/methylation domain-containing protein [Acidithiobacillus sp.]|uniref:prepilin-type N-terminal cleavage/methylation domain-containing protein n=1 Tax=Acidithiobacillus sp. TaxID=1872118 RepID=UPI00258A9EDD|nr:prepilin-type N-terminal cleavage/methylation domain-containing protein [Acidithiobacillus sp.]MDD5376000.1 prepilin-type N-terminal cleavage/methylation domain-containing protein [Acidithiobacillus sp.]